MTVPGVTTRYDLPLHEPPRLGGIARLLADGDPIALLDQARKVGFEGVVGDARKGYALSAAHLPRGQGDFELARDEARVVVEGLVEVAHPEEQHLVQVLLLDA